MSGTLGFFAVETSAVALSNSAVVDINVSDTGYRTRETDANGLVRYPGTLIDGFSLDRRANLSPAKAVVGAAWGKLSLENTGGAYSSIAVQNECSGRNVNILWGEKTYDATRGYYVDPPYAALTQFLNCVATSWLCSEKLLDIPLRDATYWLEQPSQIAIYPGGPNLIANGLNGGPNLVNKSKPRARGGTASSPILNVPPVLVDANYLIYQYTDGPGTVGTYVDAGSTYGAIYAGGVGAGFVNGGDYPGTSTDLATGVGSGGLYAVTPAAGHYYTDNAQGLFMLSAIPGYTLTINCTGAFPVHGAESNPAWLAYYIAYEDEATPAEYLDYASFSAAASALPYTAGWWWPSATLTRSTEIDSLSGVPLVGTKGVDAIGSVLAGLGAFVLPMRSGGLGILVLREPLGASADQWTVQNVVSVTPKALPADCSPPTWRWRVGFQHFFQKLTSGFNPTVTPQQMDALAWTDRYAVASNSALNTALWTPNDPPPVTTALLDLNDAQAVADALLNIWGTRRRLFDVVVPLSVGIARELGDVVTITWPQDALVYGAQGVIVGEQFRSQDSKITFTVLV